MAVFSDKETGFFKMLVSSHLMSQTLEYDYLCLPKWTIPATVNSQKYK